MVPSEYWNRVSNKIWLGQPVPSAHTPCWSPLVFLKYPLELKKDSVRIEKKKSVSAYKSQHECRRLGWWDDRPSNPAYYIEDCRILRLFSKTQPHYLISTRTAIVNPWATPWQLLGNPLQLIPGQTSVNFNPFHLSFRAKDPYFCELATACTALVRGMTYCKQGHRGIYNGMKSFLK